MADSDREGPIVSHDLPVEGTEIAGADEPRASSSGSEAGDDASKTPEESHGASTAGKVVGLVVGIPIALIVIAAIAQMAGNIYMGWGVVVINAMMAPALFELLLLLLACALVGIAFGLATLFRSDIRTSWFATLFALVEGVALLYCMWEFIIPAGFMAPLRDIPYLVKPLSGTVYVTGVNAEEKTDSDGDDYTDYSLYLAADDLPGYETGDVFEFNIGSTNYDAWKKDFGQADSSSIYGYGMTADDLKGKPVYRVEMLPNTETLISFEPAE